MPSARGYANHSLYLSKILLDGWRTALSAESVASITLAQAYLPAVRDHLRDAYGWFLLDICRPGSLPPKPPHSVDDLPETEQGLAMAGEIREFQQLERSGWLCDLLSDSQINVSSSRSSGNLAASSEAVSLEELERCSKALLDLFERMANSLDEY